MTKKEKVRYSGARPLGILPYIAMVCIALMYTLCRQHVVVCSIIMIVLCCGVYWLIYCIAQRHKASASPLGAVAIPIATVALLVGTAIITSLSFASGGNSKSIVEEGGFVHFLFTASLTFNPLHAATAIAIFSLIIGFLGCYFSAILPRACFLMQPAFIPIILCARTAGGLPEWIQIGMMACFIMAVICSARKREMSDTLEFIDNSTRRQEVAAALGLSVLILVVSTVIPKDNETVLEDKMDMFLGSNVGFGHGGNVLSNFTSASSVNRGNNELPDNLLFTVKTTNEENIDRWTFDVYNEEKGWSSLKEFDTGYDNWQDGAMLHRMPTLFSQLKSAAEGGALADYSDVLLSLPEAVAEGGYMYIKVMDDSSTRVVLHPLGTYDVSMGDYSGRFYRVEKGEIFTAYDVRSAQYLVKYASEKPVPEYSAAMENVDFRTLINDAAGEGVIDPDTANAFLKELSHAEKYKLLTGTAGISPEIMSLAAEITAGCKSDYEKAAAIEQWFGTAGFVYDLEFIPLEMTADYFLFDSKRGICSDYASAMTLLARAAGLPARYVEGFALSGDIRDENGVYNVTGSNAHAYSQIYLKGCGWVNFDGTKYAIPAENLPPEWLVPLLIVLGCLAVLALLALIFRKQLGYAVLVVTYPLRSNDNRVRAVALRMRTLAAEISGREESSMSMGEAEKILANTLSLPDEAAEIRNVADKILYCDREADIDTSGLIGCLKRLKRQKRRLRR